ncbi:MAG TPA: hypothetical protein VHE13_07240 [Opitutus sp.]|nr:hypothetical protein [Opitutus sp.]
MQLDSGFHPLMESETSEFQFVDYTPAPNRDLIVYGYIGLFTHANGVACPHGLARIHADGSLDPGFVPDLATDEAVDSAIALADGSVMVRSISYAGPYLDRIVRLLSTGAVDPTFAPVSVLGSSHFTLLHDGSVVVWGQFDAINGLARNSLARVLPDGTVDPDFAPVIADAHVEVISLATSPDDHLVVSAVDQQFAVTHNHFIRLTPAGDADPTFTPDPPTRTFASLVCLSDNRLIAADGDMVRFHADGTIDDSFIPAIPSLRSVTKVLALPRDRLAVEATTGSPSDYPISSVFILNADGMLEEDCRDLPGAEHIQTLACARSDGAVALVEGPLVWGYQSLHGQVGPPIPVMADAGLAIADPGAGTVTPLATTIGWRTRSSVGRLTLDSAGRILVEGGFTHIDGTPRAGYARFNADGSLDPTFNPVATSPLLHLPDGRTIASQRTLGPADSNGIHSYVANIVRLTSDGSLDPTFVPTDPDLLGATWLTATPDGRVLVSKFAGGAIQENKAKLLWLDPDGNVAATMPTAFSGFLLDLPPQYAIATPPVTAAVALADGKLLLGMTATAVNGSPVGKIVRLNADGSIDQTYRPDLRSLLSVQSAIPLPDGRAYVLGSRLDRGVVDTQAALRLDPNGAPEAFVSQARVHGVPLADGSYVYNSQRFFADDTLDLNYTLTLDPDYGLYSAVLADDGGLWLGGSFNKIDDQPRDGFARLLPIETAGFTVQPSSQNVFAGLAVTFRAQLGSTAPATYQWTLDGTPLPGATSRTLTLDHAAVQYAGIYRLVATVGDQTYTSEPATLTVTANTSRLVNFSARSLVSPNLPPQIGGFILRASPSRRVLLRAVGRGLPVEHPGFTLLPEPALRLHGVNGNIATDAGGALAPAIVDAGAAVGAAPLFLSYPPEEEYPQHEPTRDSALLLDLPPGEYTALTTSVDGRAGVSLFEFYDADTSSPLSATVNVSVRGHTGTGTDVLIAGFVIDGNGPQRLLIRGLGPALAPYGVPDPVADPRLTLYAGSLAYARNDDWGDTPDAAAITAAARAVNTPALADGSRDAALLVTLDPGLYTVLGQGANGAGGEMLIEIFVVP